MDVLAALDYRLQAAADPRAPRRGPVRGRSRSERLRDGRLSEALSLRLPVEVHDALAAHASAVRRSSAAVLRDALASGEDLAAAATSIDVDVLTAAARNPNTPASALLRMSEGAVQRWQRASDRTGPRGAVYPDMSDLVFYWQDDYRPPPPSMVMAALAETETTPGEALEPLVCCVRLHCRLLWHPNATRWTLETLTCCHSPYCEGEDRGGAYERLAAA